MGGDPSGKGFKSEERFPRVTDRTEVGVVDPGSPWSPMTLHGHRDRVDVPYDPTPLGGLCSRECGDSREQTVVLSRRERFVNDSVPPQVRL